MAFIDFVLAPLMDKAELKDEKEEKKKQASK
jgi:hypothetical protein